MLEAVRDELARILLTRQASQLTVHDRSDRADMPYAVSYDEEDLDAAGQTRSDVRISRDVPITRDEAVMLLAMGATWTGRPGNEPR